MKLNKYYYKELPIGYTPKKIIDAKEKTTAVVFTLLSLAFTVLAFIVVYLIKPFSVKELRSDLTSFLIADLCFVALIFVYVVMHELTHGVGFKIFTSEKLKFGVTLTVAFCGAPTAYVKKWPAIITTLLPFTVYSIVFLLVYFLTGNMYIQAISGLLFAIHFGGCIGDFYVSLYLLLKGKSDMLVNDDGAKQVFYEYNPKMIDEGDNNEGDISTES